MTKFSLSLTTQLSLAKSSQGIDVARYFWCAVKLRSHVEHKRKTLWYDLADAVKQSEAFSTAPNRLAVHHQPKPQHLWIHCSRGNARNRVKMTTFPTFACTSLASSPATNQYKLSSICFSSVIGTGPQYLADILKTCVLSRQLRSSSDARLFQTPSVNIKSTGQRTFAYQGPTGCVRWPWRIAFITPSTVYNAENNQE